MPIQKFFDKWNGKGVDWDNYYGFQCMDLYHQYNFEVIGGTDIPAPAAKDVWDNYPKDYYNRVKNTPNGVPQKGDIIIWGTGIGQYGHIAIFDHGNDNSFVSFDQNWPLNSLCHYQNHNYNGVLGWLHPKNTIITQPITQTDQTIIDLGQFGKHEVQAIRGFYAEATTWKTDLENCRSANNQQADMIGDLREQNRILLLSNETLTKKMRELLESPTSPYISPKTSLGKLFDQLARYFG